ncbi:hypothetical protein U1Q18_003873 [Sarracenia purpurea var. burkii]
MAKQKKGYGERNLRSRARTRTVEERKKICGSRVMSIAIVGAERFVVGLGFTQNPGFTPNPGFTQKDLWEQKDLWLG